MRSARDSEGCLGKRRPVYPQTDENSFSYHADRLRVGCDRTTMTVAAPSAERKRHRIDSRTIWGVYWSLWQREAIVSSGHVHGRGAWAHSLSI